MTVYPRLSNTVSKLGYAICTVNLPAISTCREDAPCKKYCYACRGNFMFKNVKNSLQKNLDVFISEPQKFFDVLDYQLNMMPYKFFRWHSSGDIVNERYLEGMFWLARRHKNTKFLCFTKKYELVNEYMNHHRKPANLVLVFSNWQDWRCDNPHNLPTAWVEFPNIEQEIPKTATRCSGYCGECVNTKASCWKMKNGDAVVFKKH